MVILTIFITFFFLVYLNLYNEASKFYGGHTIFNAHRQRPIRFLFRYQFSLIKHIFGRRLTPICWVSVLIHKHHLHCVWITKQKCKKNNVVVNKNRQEKTIDDQFILVSIHRVWSSQFTSIVGYQSRGKLNFVGPTPSSNPSILNHSWIFQIS